MSHLYGYLSSAHLVVGVAPIAESWICPWMALASAPKFVFDIHKTLTNTVRATLHNDETEHPVDLSTVPAKEHTQDHF